MPKIILLGNKVGLFPLQKYLEMYTKFSVYNLSYSLSPETLVECLDSISNKIYDILFSEDEEIIIIAYSLGNIIGANLHKYGFNIKLLILISPPPINMTHSLPHKYKIIPGKFSVLFDIKSIYNFLLQLN